MGVVGPGLCNGHVGLDLGAARTRAGASAAPELQCAAQMAHRACCRIIGGHATGASGSTRRERGILTWMAHGKSTGVIAQILGASRQIVDTLARRLFDKLDVSDRTSAAIRGTCDDLLDLVAG